MNNKINEIKISVIIPCFNEDKTITKILNDVKIQKNKGIIHEIIVVDDGSIDQTPQILKKCKSKYDKLIVLKENSGKGYAIKQGIKVSTGNFILFQDADLEYDPNDYKNLVKPIFDLEADLVIGSRFSGSLISRTSYFWNKLGNRSITLLFNILNNTTFTDIYTCYVVFKKSLIDEEKLKSSGWQQQAEILGKVVKTGERFFEVPVNYYGRTYEEGKKIRYYHIFSIFLMIFKIWLTEKKMRKNYEL